MAISRAEVDLINELDSDQLEILCRMDLGKEDQALSLSLTALLYMIDRLDTGSDDTAIDRKKADEFRAAAKTIAIENPFLQTNPDDLTFLKPTKTKHKRFLSTDMITWSASNIGTRLRLFIHRMFNKVLPNFSRFSEGILPREYSLTGIFAGLAELIGHGLVILKSTITKPLNQKTGNELSRWQRFKVSRLNAKDQKAALSEEKEKQALHKSTASSRFFNTATKGTRPTAMINAAVWPFFNFVTYKPILDFIAARLPATVVIGTFTAATGIFIVAALNIVGTIMDIFLDTGSALYGYLKHRSLLNKLTAHNQKNHTLNPLIIEKAQNTLNQKLTELLKTKVIRLFSYNLTLCVAMILMITPALTPIGAAIALGIAFAGALADLPNFFTKSRYEKFRTLSVLGILTAAIAGAVLLTVWPPLVFTLPFLGLATLSVPFIGGCIALLVGTLGFGRAFAFADWSWGAEKIAAIKESPIANFLRNPFSTKTSAPRKIVEYTPIQINSAPPIDKTLLPDDDEITSANSSPHSPLLHARSGTISPLGASTILKANPFGPLKPKPLEPPVGTSKSTAAVPRLPLPRSRTGHVPFDSDDESHPLKHIATYPNFNHSTPPLLHHGRPVVDAYKPLESSDDEDEPTLSSPVMTDDEYSPLPLVSIFSPPVSPAIETKISPKQIRDRTRFFEKPYATDEDSESQSLPRREKRSISGSPRKLRSLLSPYRS